MASPLAEAARALADGTLRLDTSALDACVRDVLREASASGAEMTARQVRNSVESRLGLPADALVNRKEELMAIISAALGDPSGGGTQSDQHVDAAAVREVQVALADPDGGPTRAALLVAELTGESATAGREALEAMALLSEACATSEAAARRLVDARVAGALAAFLPPTAPKTAASLAVRMLSAIALHASLTEALVRSAALPALLARLGAEIGDVGIQCAALLHNLADAPATRMRLLHAGALEVVTRVLVEPAASDGLKEHLLTAMHSLAGVTEEGIAVPELLGRFLRAKLPGTQRSALSALQIVRERQPGVEARLKGVNSLMEALVEAAASADATVASGAAEMLAVLQAGGG